MSTSEAQGQPNHPLPSGAEAAPAAAAAAAVPLLEVSRLQQALARFADERDWQQFHSPKNLVMALGGEVGELTELFQWVDEAASFALAQQPETARAVRDELADVLLYLVRLADRLGVDLDEAVRSKLQTNARKYPVERAKGSSRKLTG